jgi:uroporphyrinogen-III synthase
MIAAVDDPLHGFCVAVTADRRWEEQAELLRRRGATVLHGPSIRTLPVGAGVRLRAVTEQLIANPPAMFVANTGIGVRSWMAAAESWGLGAELLGALGGAQIFARGAKAAGAVHSLGLDVAAKAKSERLRELVDAIVKALEPGSSVAVQRDGRGDPAQMQRLRNAGADVVEIPVYDWRLPDDDHPAVRLIEAVVAGRVHAVTFTSGPAIENLFLIAAEHDLDRRLLAALNNDRMTVACVGPVCAEAAVAHGINDAVVPATSRLGPLIRALTERLVEQTITVDLGAERLTVSGTVARVGHDDVELTDTEARVLMLLVERRGTVVTKTELLRRVWSDAVGDPHVVEVTVGRLRRRLGHRGHAIRAIPRRGYMLTAT